MCFWYFWDILKENSKNERQKNIDDGPKNKRKIDKIIPYLRVLLLILKISQKIKEERRARIKMIKIGRFWKNRGRKFKFFYKLQKKFQVLIYGDPKDNRQDLE